jgi:hypothetical protein
MRRCKSCGPSILRSNNRISEQNKHIDSLICQTTYNDAISANDIAIAVDPTPASRAPQTSDAGPPLSKLN